MHMHFTSQFAVGGTLHKQLRPAGHLSGQKAKAHECKHTHTHDKDTHTVIKHSTSNTDQQFVSSRQKHHVSIPSRVKP